MPNGNYFFSMTCFYHSVTENSQVTMIENHKKKRTGLLRFLKHFQILGLEFCGLSQFVYVFIDFKSAVEIKKTLRKRTPKVSELHKDSQPRLHTYKSRFRSVFIILILLLQVNQSS